MTPDPLYNPETPWNRLPGLPPKADIEPPEVLRACIAARAELARVGALGEGLPNQAILVDAIPLQEARSSSEIENIVTTGDALYQALASGDEDSQMDPNAKEVLRYREALWAGLGSLQKRKTLDIALFESICSLIRGMDVQVRRDEVSIGAPDIGLVVYTPPGGEHVGRLLSDLEGFLNDDSDGVDPLVKMAVAHYQFEAIHPFMDGNGRTGRILNILYLCRRGLLQSPTIYLSRYFIENRANYYRYLREVTETGNWTQWILYMLAAVKETSRDTIARIEKMRDLADEMAERAKGKTRAAEREGFMEILFKWPYCKIGIMERELPCSRITAKRYLDDMVTLGLLARIKIGRVYYYVNERLADLLGE